MMDAIMHARKGKRKKKKLSEIWCDMHVFVLYGSVDAPLGKLESKKAGIYLSLTSYYCCWAIAKVKLGVHRRYVHEKGRLLIPH